MSLKTQFVFRADPMYPDDDGLPMSDNTLQFEWIVLIKTNLEAIFKGRDDVFVAGNLLWYPVEGDPKTRTAPDAFVAFGRPKAYRGSYKQWDEENIPPQVVFEVLSPGNRTGAMTKKLRFYDRYGVEEYYLIDPDNSKLSGWIRRNEALVKIDEMNGWVSPLLGIRFEVDRSDIQVHGPDGERFRSYVEVQQEVDEQRERAEVERERAERLAARLRDLGIDPDA